MAPKKKATKKRTTLHSKTGKKLYAKRTKKGQFADIQSFERAHGSDVKRVSKGRDGRAQQSREGTAQGSLEEVALHASRRHTVVHDTSTLSHRTMEESLRWARSRRAEWMSALSDTRT